MTTVPVTRANAVNAAMPTVWRLISGDTGRTASPSSGSEAWWTSTTALATSTSDDDHVPLDGERVEVDEHGDPAEHDLGENAGDEAERQPGQIPPPGDADQRTEHGGDHGDADETGEQAVELLDRGVARRDIDEPGAAARRPVGTPQP